MLSNNNNLIKVKVFQYGIHFLKRSVIWILIIAVCISSNGCAPALMAGTVIAVNYIAEVEKQNKKAEAAQRTYLASRQKTLKTLDPPKQISPESLIRESEIAYGAFQWDKAKRLLKEALEKKALSTSSQWKALILLGAMEYQDGNTNEARGYFREAHKQNSTMTPSSELFPPQMITFYKSVR